FLISKFHADVETLCPEVTLMDGAAWFRRHWVLAESGTCRHKRGIDIAIDQVSRTGHVAEPDKRIAGVNTKYRGKLIADIEAKLGNEAELIVLCLAAVACEGQQAAGGGARSRAATRSA